MNRELIATTSISIFASPSEVWKALIDPDIIKQYMHGTETITTWKLHDPIMFRGEWEGVPYIDKGVIVEIIPERVLSYSYWSSMSGKEDKPENYANVTYELTQRDNETDLSITQDNIADEKTKKHSVQNWTSVLNDLKKLLEK